MKPLHNREDEEEVISLTKCLVLTVLVALILGATGMAASATERVAVLLPPHSAMGYELVDLVEEFNKDNIQVDVYAESRGPYVFWEDTAEGVLWGYVKGSVEWTITHTYEDFDLERYGAVIVGPGHGHSLWLGETKFTAQEILWSALEQEIPIGGVSYGASALVWWEFLDGRSAAMPPYYRGVITQGTNKALFFSECPDVTYENAPIWIDQSDGRTPIVTATYGALRKFAREMAVLMDP